MRLARGRFRAQCEEGRTKEGASQCIMQLYYQHPKTDPNPLYPLPIIDLTPPLCLLCLCLFVVSRQWYDQ